MLKVYRTKRFIKDLHLASKRGLDLSELEVVVNKIANREVLEPKYHDHKLTGFDDVRECHIKPDWLLLYVIDDKSVQLVLLRTGTHSDIF